MPRKADTHVRLEADVRDALKADMKDGETMSEVVRRWGKNAKQVIEKDLKTPYKW